MGSKPRRKKEGTAATKPRKLATSGKSNSPQLLAPSAEVELPPALDERAPADGAFADALASAFLDAPGGDALPVAAVDTPSPDTDSDAATVELTFIVDPPEAARTEAVEVEIAEPVCDEAEADEGESHTSSVELPFIVDPETPPDEVIAIVASEPRPEPEPWVDLVLEPTPRKARTADEWVDQVLEPTKLPFPPRPSRARIAAAKSAKSAKAAKAAKAAAPKTSPTIAAALATAVAATATKATAVPSAKAAAAKAAAAKAEPSASTTRWWLVAPALLLMSVVLYLNRPGRPHAPLPAGIVGQWTTAFWLYEHQTLEIKPDTVVVTLDEPEEGRYPITRVETSDAGRETAVKISYRLASGDEKVLDFLADRDPTTALRFRAHSGLVWTRAQE